jgi:Flp pilus assembly protein TadB
MESPAETQQQALSKAKYEGRAEAYLECSFRALAISILALLLETVQDWTGLSLRYTCVMLITGSALGLYLRVKSERKKAQEPS